MGLDLSPGERVELWQQLVKGIDAYVTEVGGLGAGPPTDPAAVTRLLSRFDFDDPLDPQEALQLTLRALRDLQQHAGHPRYFGLFTAAPTAIAIAGETLAATFNSCLASRDSSPFGVAAEEKLVAAFGAKFGYHPDEADGIITSGGSESNLSATLMAIRHRFPDCGERGLVGLRDRPLVYMTAEVHPSIPRAVRLAGLGASAVRTVSTDAALRLDLVGAREQVLADREAGFEPMMLVVTAGTTGAGTVDPLDGAAELAAELGLWLHVDAAWGGAAALLPELRATFRALGRADSITFDPHKWMSVPLGIGLMLTRHGPLLARTFGTGQRFLDHPEVADTVRAEPFDRSLRWSRSFGGLKLLLTLAVVGWRGFEESLRHQVRLGQQLRCALAASCAGWQLVNDTPLPVVCFVPRDPAEQEPERLRLLAKMVNAAGRARIFLVRIGSRYTLRASVTNHATTAEDIAILVDELDAAVRVLRVS